MKKLLLLAMLAIASPSFAQVGRLEIPQQTGPSTGNRTNRVIVPSANQILGFDANKKLVAIAPETALANSATTYGILLKAHITLSSADLLALYSAPKLLVAAPGSGHSIAITKLVFAITRTSTV